jgi:uncharacterized cupredoxin-like copper-binding protein
MTFLPTRRSAVAALLAASAIGLAACGSDDSSSSSSGSSGSTSSDATPAPTTASDSGGGGGKKLAISADESKGLAFDKKTLSAKAGSVTIDMANPSADKQPHAIAIEGNGVDKSGETVQPGGSDSTVTADLKPGKYTFFCPVPGHREAGMEGTLTVQ